MPLVNHRTFGCLQSATQWHILWLCSTPGGVSLFGEYNHNKSMIKITSTIINQEDNKQHYFCKALDTFQSTSHFVYFFITASSVKILCKHFQLFILVHISSFLVGFIPFELLLLYGYVTSMSQQRVKHPHFFRIKGIYNKSMSTQGRHSHTCHQHQYKLSFILKAFITQCCTLQRVQHTSTNNFN